MLEPAQLAVEGLAQARVAVTQGANGNASDTVEVTTAIAVPYPDASAFHQLHREAGIGVHHRVFRIRC
jgi:hypothetical protein